MSHRSSPAWRRRAALLSLAAAVGVPLQAGAQTTRSFELCFTGGVRSCSLFELTTTPFLDGGGARIGTAVDVNVRHAEGTEPGAASRSALAAFSFGYQGALGGTTGDTDVLDDLGVPLVTPFGQDGAPDPLFTAGWQLEARSSTTSAADNYLGLQNALFVADPAGGPTLTQLVGGCGVAAASGVIDAAFRTELWTCGGGSYRYLTFTDAWFDVEDVRAVGMDVYARFDGAATGTSAFCTAYLDAPTSIGDDGAGTFGDVCAARDLAVSTPVPEPGTAALAATGVALLAGVAARRRRGSA